MCGPRRILKVKCELGFESGFFVFVSVRHRCDTLWQRHHHVSLAFRKYIGYIIALKKTVFLSNVSSATADVLRQQFAILESRRVLEVPLRAHLGVCMIEKNDV